MYMFRPLFMITMSLTFTACVDEHLIKGLDGKMLTERHCASCHDLHIPPVISDTELAPPMLAISVHIPDLVSVSNASERTSKAIDFVVDYVRDPSAEKAFCDKESIKRYGLMPSQKERVTKEEAKAIATYMFKHYTQENLMKKMKEKVEFDALDPGKKVALKYRCLGCHKVDRKVIGPSFIAIAKRHVDAKEKMIQSIKEGSKERWESSNGAIMPPFEQMDDDELEILVEWILSFGTSVSSDPIMIK